MNEKSILELLQKAYRHILSFDGRAYKRYMEQARYAIEKLPENSDDARRLQGEWLLVSTIESIQDMEELCKKLRKAEKLIDGQSQVLPQGAAIFGEFYSVFGTCNAEPGYAEKNIERIREAEEIFFRLTGGGKGATQCYLLQMAYYQGELQTAQELANEAFDIGKKYKQELVCLCAAEFLARIAIHIQDEELWNFGTDYIEKVKEGMEDASPVCKKHAQLIVYTLDLAVGLLQTVPEWLKMGDFGAVSTEWGFEMVEERIPAGCFAMALLVQIEYLTYSEQPVRALAAADMMEKVYRIKSVVVEAYVALLRAGCYGMIHDVERMRGQLFKAIKLIAPDGLWLIVAEFVPSFGEELYRAARKVSESAVDHIREIGEDFWEKLEPIRETAIKDAPEVLSVREEEVAALLMQGKKNTEIAEELHISVRTVRTHLENIYRKRGINRRTQLPESLKKDTVRIAGWVKKI